MFLFKYIILNMKINFDNETNKVLIEMLREAYKNENYELECIIGNQSHMSRNTHKIW